MHLQMMEPLSNLVTCYIPLQEYKFDVHFLYCVCGEDIRKLIGLS